MLEDRIYNNRDYDYNIILQDRIDEVAREITEYLKSTDRMQKTIVFCASEDHAERMRIALINHNADMVKENLDYCVRITGSDVYGKSKLDYFISVSSPYPVIATTSELLSTGADCKMTKLIVLDKTVESMTTFKQIIGRGTRIREKEGKTHFVVMDFRNVTRLFSDPDWDGPVEQVEGFQHGSGGNKPKGGEPGGIGEEPPVDPVETPIVDKDGCRVKIINKTVSVYDANGKLLRQEDKLIMAMQSGFIKRIRDIMRMDAGINGDAQRIEQMVWMLFLKVYDAKEDDWELNEDNYESIIPEDLRWRNWAKADSNGHAMTGDKLLNFVNNTLFPVLKGNDVKEGDTIVYEGIKVTPDTPIKKAIVKSTFEDANNYMKDGVYLRQVIDVIDEIEFDDVKESHAFGFVYAAI